MLTIILLCLSLHSAPSAPKPIESGALHLDPPSWAFVPLPSWQDSPSTGVEALMYRLGIDAAVPVESNERADLDVYAGDVP